MLLAKIAHRLGHAHSIELWDGADLVGGYRFEVGGRDGEREQQPDGAANRWAAPVAATTGLAAMLTLAD